MVQEKGIARLTFEQVQQLGQWRLKGYSDAEIASSIGYSVGSVSRFIRLAIARSQIPADCKNRALIIKNREMNSPLPPLPKENWNTHQESRCTVVPRSQGFYNRVGRGWTEEAALTPPLPQQREKKSRNEAILAYWEQTQNYLATAKHFQLSPARTRRLIIRQLQKRRDKTRRLG